jgi:uncharacterized circularly permuted ATP-grasp superfamily protein/uncharacterized alpha-E superfamily protein
MSPPVESKSSTELRQTSEQSNWLSSLARRIPTAKPHHFDEMRQSATELRAPWQSLFAQLGRESIDRLADYANTVNHVIAQNGISYNVFTDRQDQVRPWSLNPLPMVIDSDDWHLIETSLAQRARLLNQIVHDVYHQGDLLAAAYLPSALVLGNPGYLHAMRNVKVPGNNYLYVIAFDVARDEQGRWWVIGQRTQSPSGLGYVLENRLIISRLFPQAYREMRVQHLATSYRRLLAALETQAQSLAQGAPPRFAFLTPGPYSETYFEHAYLARYLGIPLVEGPDLTIRNNEVFLKTVQGLQRIHGLMRRLDDDFCDPLELRADSALGIPGLLQSVRAGKVVMANALGTGFLESPAVQGFLPAICEHLLGEPLLMPSLHTWWCGETAAWKDVSPRLQTQVIKPTFANQTSTNFEPVIGSLLDEDARNQWRARIERQPDIYTTQTYLPFSQVPTFNGHSIEPRTAMMRFYALIGPDNQWHVMPGGMARVAALDPHIVSIRSGGTTLDTWVMSDTEVDSFSMLPGQTTASHWQTDQELVSSRSAENLFWLGRYTERAEAMVRLARETLMLLSTNRVASLTTLNDAMTYLGRTQNLVTFDSPSMSDAPEAFGQMVIARLQQSGCGGLMDVVQAMLTAMRSVRDRLPVDHVEIPAKIKSLLLAEKSQHDMMRVLDHVELPLAALVGYQLDRMTKDIGWRMLAAGRLLERLINQSQIITHFFESSAVYTEQGFDSLLTLFDSAITYRTRYQRQQEILPLLDLIVLDQTNPRALHATASALAEHIAHLPDSTVICKTLADLNHKPDSTLDMLRLVKDMTRTALELSDEISHQFFAHITEQRFTS